MFVQSRSLLHGNSHLHVSRGKSNLIIDQLEVLSAHLASILVMKLHSVPQSVPPNRLPFFINSSSLRTFLLNREVLCIIE